MIMRTKAFMAAIGCVAAFIGISGVASSANEARPAEQVYRGQVGRISRPLGVHASQAGDHLGQR